jgi:hypothetical protein
VQRFREKNVKKELIENKRDKRLGKIKNSG